MPAFIDRYLNGITMYKTIMYALGVLMAVAIIASFLGYLPYAPLWMVATAAVLVFVSYGVNEAIGHFLRIPTNPESPVITAGILFFVLVPAESLYGILLLAFTAVIAMASKYVFAIRRQHVFNPAAIAAVIVGIPTGIAAWWIGTPVMLAPLLIMGILLVRKVRRFQMVLAVLIPGAIVATLVGISLGQSASLSLWQFIASGPALFFAMFMVTEPFTSPGTRTARLVYAAAIGVVSNLPVHLGIVFASPELTLVLANFAAFWLSMRERVVLTLADKQQIAQDTFAFRFDASRKPDFEAGQYLEWTLQHATPDLRGIRRFFTIASSPTEERLQIGVKFFPDGSSFKAALKDLAPGSKMYASMRGGDFTLPRDTSEKLAFIAGGIGVTPFRSMVRSVLDRNEQRDIALFYACKTSAEIAYHDLWDEASQKIGMKMLCVLANEPNPAGDAVQGFITPELVTSRLPDWAERTFYLSGPDAMVRAYKKLLRGMGVADSRIRTDYFPGF